MITFIRGNLFSQEEENVIIEVGGIGCHVLVPPAVFPRNLKPGDEVFLNTFLQVREDSWQLFGFPEKEQLEVFRHLISVSGIGPRLGLAILNYFSCQEIIKFVVSGDSSRLSRVPGIGKKIAQRLVLELKEKFKKFHTDDSNNRSNAEEMVFSSNQDVILALTQLGYSVNEAQAATIKVSRALGAETNTQEMIKGALKILGKY